MRSPTIQLRQSMPLVAVALLLLATSPAVAQTTSSQTGADILRQLLTAPATTDAALAALAATGDKELWPLFAAVAEKGNRSRRLFAVSAAAKLGARMWRKSFMTASETIQPTRFEPRRWPNSSLSRPSQTSG